MTSRSAGIDGALEVAARKFKIRLPERAERHEQDEEWFEVELVEQRPQRLRVHDYDVLYSIPGLYEALVYDTLQCKSPEAITDTLKSVLDGRGESMASLRVLDLGAGNGIVAEELRKRGVKEQIVGLDLLPEAKTAAMRDRPEAYDDYLVADLCNLNADEQASLREADLNCLITVAALGFGDIPPHALARAFDFIAIDGWLAMTIKEEFLDPSDDGGFGRLVRRMIDEGVIDVSAKKRYQHRIAISGEPIYYVSLVAQKKQALPEQFVTDAATPR